MVWYVVVQCVVFGQVEIVYQILGCIQCSIVVEQFDLECWQCVQVVLWVVIGILYFQVFFQVYFWESGGYVIGLVVQCWQLVWQYWQFVDYEIVEVLVVGVVVCVIVVGEVYWYVEQVVYILFVVEIVFEYEVEYVGVVGIGIGLDV